MAGPSADDSEIFSRFDESRSKKFSPHAIDRHARRQRIRLADSPLRQSTAVQRSAGRQGRQEMRNAGPHALGSGTKCTAMKNVGVGGAWPFFTYECDGALFGKPIEFFVQRRNLSLKLARGFVAVGEIKIADLGKFVLGP